MVLVWKIRLTDPIWGSGGRPFQSIARRRRLVGFSMAALRLRLYARWPATCLSNTRLFLHGQAEATEVRLPHL